MTNQMYMNKQKFRYEEMKIDREIDIYRLKYVRIYLAV